MVNRGMIQSGRPDKDMQNCVRLNLNFDFMRPLEGTGIHSALGACVVASPLVIWYGDRCPLYPVGFSHRP